MTGELPDTDTTMYYTLILDARTPIGEACVACYAAQNVPLILADPTWIGRSDSDKVPEQLGKETRIELCNSRSSQTAITKVLQKIEPRYPSNGKSTPRAWAINRLIYAAGHPMPESASLHGIPMAEYLDGHLVAPSAFATTVLQHMLRSKVPAEIVVCYADTLHSNHVQPPGQNKTQILDQFPLSLVMEGRRQFLRVAEQLIAKTGANHIALTAAHIPLPSVGLKDTDPTDSFGDRTIEEVLEMSAGERASPFTPHFYLTAS